MSNKETENLPIGKGGYLLLTKLPEEEKITVGRMGSQYFPRGYYLYAGSAMNGLKRRIDRHLKKQKRLHWHIDYLLEKASIEEIICIETENKIECELAQRLGNILAWVPGFGASDCKCKSHLYFAKNKSTLKKKIKEIFVKWGPHYSVKYSEEFNLAGKGKNDRS